MNAIIGSSLLPFWVPLGLFALIWVYMLIHRQFRLGVRTPEEVTAFLRKIDWDETQEVFDLARERSLRLYQSDRHFRRIMRVRIHKAREFIARMYHNVRVVHEWANTEVRIICEKPREMWTDHEQQIMALAAEAAQFRMLALQRLIQLSVWTVLRIESWTPVPSIAALRRCGPGGETDLIDLYRRLQNSSSQLALAHGLAFHDEVRGGF